jgi:Ca2+-binding EF-hand superfamily protein
MKRRLVEKYDANRNGKIDVEERRDYVRELARIRKQIEKETVAEFQQQRIKGQGSLLQTRRGREILGSFDKNKDGRLDSSELDSVRDEIWKALRTTRKQLDPNGDGIVDAGELQAAERPLTQAPGK